MKIFIQEFSTGGGFAQTLLDFNLIIEGFGMLRLLIQNFKRLNLEVITTLDSRLLFLIDFLEADEILLINQGESFLEKSESLVMKCDSFIIIAPGTDGILKNTIEYYQKLQKSNLNCTSQAIDFSTAKHKMYELCSKINIQYPRTIIIENKKRFREISKDSFVKISDIIEFTCNLDVNFPVIIKPDDGVACEGLFLCNGKDEIQFHLQKSTSKNILVQEYIEGSNFSVTVLVLNDIIDVISINQQLIEFSNEKTEYLGGISNIKTKFEDEIKLFSSKILSQIEGINGLVGLDFILTANKELYFIEINPRITTPICGLISNKVQPIDFFHSRQLDEKQNKMLSYFSKAKFILKKEIPPDFYMKICDFESIVTPPIRVDGNNFICMIRGWGRNPFFAKKNFTKNFSKLLDKLKKLKN
ncbi:MAG: ATP-grasp domain-containing protein [Candidatus Heimdallarchaeota archaeon]|nr:ATP-grasp domain-containing protein [Candidatus Heimdallarchaeota archaeon]